MKKLLIHFFIFLSLNSFAQDTIQRENHLRGNPDSLINAVHKRSQWLIGSASALTFGGSFIFLNKAWYKGYPRSKFHTFNDNGEWLQMDKAGHAWTTYTISNISTKAWQWAGVDRKKAMWLGTGTSLLYTLSIEYLDGRSAKWGWSWGDAGADVLGASLFASQELIWHQQKVELKFSPGYHHYKQPDLKERADDLYGKSLPERILKDYNAQRYYLSFNLKSFFQNSRLPPWLNVAIGYGAEGMFGGFENIAYDKNGNIIFDRRDIKRYRQWYLTPDFDLSKIKTKSKLLKTVFEILYFVVPFPSLEFSNGKFKFDPITN